MNYTDNISVKVQKLWIPSFLASEVVKDSHSLTIFSMFIQLHMLVKPGAIKYPSIGYLASWFHISKPTFLKVSKSELFSELFEMDKGVLRAKSLRGTRFWAGRMIALFGRDDEKTDKWLGVPVKVEDFESIRKAKDIIYKVITVSQISVLDAKCEKNDREFKHVMCEEPTPYQGAETQRDAFIAAQDGNVRPLDYFAKVGNCSYKKAQRIIFSLKDDGVIGSQLMRKTLIWRGEDSWGQSPYDYMDAENKRLYASYAGRLVYMGGRTFVHCAANRYWIKQVFRHEYSDGSCKAVKKKVKIIHVADSKWNPEYEPRVKRRKRSREKEEAGVIDSEHPWEVYEIESALEVLYRNIECRIESMRNEAKVISEDTLLFRGKEISTTFFEEQITLYRKHCREIEKYNVETRIANERNRQKTLKSEIPGKKPEMPTLRLFDYANIDRYAAPIPTDIIDGVEIPHYSVVSNDTERWARFHRLSDKEKQLLLRNPHLDLANREDRRKLSDMIRAERDENRQSYYRGQFEKEKHLIAAAEQWDTDLAMQIATAAYTAWDYFKDSGRNVYTRIKKAGENRQKCYQSTLNEYHYWYDVATDQGKWMEASYWEDMLENAPFPTTLECLADDEERDLITEYAVTGLKLCKLLFQYGSNSYFKETEAGKVLQRLYEEDKKRKDEKKRVVAERRIKKMKEVKKAYLS